MTIIICIYNIVVIVLLILLIYTIIKMNRYKNELEAEKDIFLYNKNKISMIEYHYRNFKEGQNAFTTLRKISDTLKDFYN